MSNAFKSVSYAVVPHVLINVIGIDSKNLVFEFPMLVDSDEMTDEQRAQIVRDVFASEHETIMISHGTSTMVKTAKALYEYQNRSDATPEDKKKKLVLVGSMRPYCLKENDVQENLRAAYKYALNAESGVHIAAPNGIFSDPYKVRKNLPALRFEAIGRNSNPPPSDPVQEIPSSDSTGPDIRAIG